MSSTNKEILNQIYIYGVQDLGDPTQGRIRRNPGGDSHGNTGTENPEPHFSEQRSLQE